MLVADDLELVLFGVVGGHVHRNELVEEGERGGGRVQRWWYTHRSLPRTRNFEK